MTSARRRRLRWIVALGAGLILAAALFVNYRFYLPIGAGPAGGPVAQELFAKPWTERKVLLVGIGDSVTAGFGARRGYSYLDRLVANPPDEFAGLEGCCLQGVLPNLEKRNTTKSFTKPWCGIPPCGSSRCTPNSSGTESIAVSGGGRTTDPATRITGTASTWKTRMNGAMTRSADCY